MLVPGLCALSVLFIVAIGEQVLERYASHEALVDERLRVTERLGTLRARIEGQINANLMLAQGLTAVVKHHPDLDQAEFARVGAEIDTGISALRNIAAAPGMVVSMIYPIEGNEAAIGLDYHRHPTQAATAQRAMDTGKMVVAGPLPLVQGGVGIIARVPVFLTSDNADSARIPWGLVSAVLDADTLYRNAGLSTFATQFQVAIRGADGTGSTGKVFFGEQQVFEHDPVVLDVTLPSGSWQLAAVPNEGWGQITTNHLMIRLFAVVIAAVAATAVYALVRAHTALRNTAGRLRESQALFEQFMDHLPAGAYIRDPANGRFEFRNHWFSKHFPDTESNHGAGTNAAHGNVDEILEDDRRTLRAGFLRADELRVDQLGEPRYFDMQRFVIPRSGSVPLVGAVINDVSPRVQAEQRRADSESRLNAAEAIAHVGHWEYRVRDGDIHWSDETYRIFGLAPQSETITYENLIQRVHPDDRADHDAYLERILTSKAGELIAGFSYRLIRPDGTERTVSVWVRVEYDDNGGPLRLFGALQDITEYKRLEQHLRQRLDELTLWQEVTLGREDRVRELKREINALLAAQGQPSRYSSQGEPA